MHIRSKENDGLLAEVIGVARSLGAAVMADLNPEYKRWAVQELIRAEIRVDKALEAPTLGWEGHGFAEGPLEGGREVGSGAPKWGLSTGNTEDVRVHHHDQYGGSGGREWRGRSGWMGELEAGRPGSIPPLTPSTMQRGPGEGWREWNPWAQDVQPRDQQTPVPNEGNQWTASGGRGRSISPLQGGRTNGGVMGGKEEAKVVEPTRTTGGMVRQKTPYRPPHHLKKGGGDGHGAMPRKVKRPFSLPPPPKKQGGGGSGGNTTGSNAVRPGGTTTDSNAVRAKVNGGGVGGPPPYTQGSTTVIKHREEAAVGKKEGTKGGGAAPPPPPPPRSGHPSPSNGGGGEAPPPPTTRSTSLGGTDPLTPPSKIGYELVRDLRLARERYLKQLNGRLQVHTERMAVEMNWTGEQEDKFCSAPLGHLNHCAVPATLAAYGLPFTESRVRELARAVVKFITVVETVERAAVGTWGLVLSQLDCTTLPAPTVPALVEDKEIFWAKVAAGVRVENGFDTNTLPALLAIMFYSIPGGLQVVGVEGGGSDVCIKNFISHLWGDQVHPHATFFPLDNHCYFNSEAVADMALNQDQCKLVAGRISAWASEGQGAGMYKEIIPTSPPTIPAKIIFTHGGMKGKTPLDVMVAGTPLSENNLGDVRVAMAGMRSMLKGEGRASPLPEEIRAMGEELLGMVEKAIDLVRDITVEMQSQRKAALFIQLNNLRDKHAKGILGYKRLHLAACLRQKEREGAKTGGGGGLGAN